MGDSPLYVFASVGRMELTSSGSISFMSRSYSTAPVGMTGRMVESPCGVGLFGMGSVFT